MHELLLFGQVPEAHCVQVMNVLAGITAMQPQRVTQRHLIYKPTVGLQERGPKVGGTQEIASEKRRTQQPAQNTELYFVQLVQDLEEDDFGPPPNDITRESRPWRMEFADLPEAGRKSIASRLISATDIKGGDPDSYMKSLGYSYDPRRAYQHANILTPNRYVGEYMLDGHRFISRNTILLLHRIARLPSPTDSSSHLDRELPAFDTLKPVDPSGARLLHASIRLSDGSKADLLLQGTTELQAMQKMLKGVVDLVVPDRLSLDTRAR